MGFSVSGSTAIIFIGVLVAFGVMFPAVMDSNERMGDAQAGQSDRLLEQQNTEIRINRTQYDGGTNELTVEIESEGTVALGVPKTDLLVDGQYVEPDGTTVYESLDSQTGDANTTVWLAGEVLEVTASYDATPERVKIVTENGVSDATEEVQ